MTTCSILTKLRRIAREIVRADLRENAILEEQKAAYLAQGKAFTDPRTGQTFFPPRKGVSR